MVGSFYHNTLATITKYISYDTFKNSKNPYSSLQSLPLKILKCIPPRKSSPKDKQEKNNRNWEKKYKIRDPKSIKTSKKDSVQSRSLYLCPEYVVFWNES